MDERKGSVIVLTETFLFYLSILFLFVFLSTYMNKIIGIVIGLVTLVFEIILKRNIDKFNKVNRTNIKDIRERLKYYFSVQVMIDISILLITIALVVGFKMNIITVLLLSVLLFLTEFTRRLLVQELDFKYLNVKSHT